MNKSPSQDPRMYDSWVEFSGIRLAVDPINRTRTEESDNICPIVHEEQPFTWEFSKPFINAALQNQDGNLDFLDVGTGSGVFAILMATKFQVHQTLAIDRSKRAVVVAQENAKRNGVSFPVRHELYNINTAPPRSVKVIGFNPPYHIYPSEVHKKLPQHAQSGSEGQGEFKNQLAIANNHLASGGIIFFNQECLGDDKGPYFLQYIPQLIEENPSLIYCNIFPSISTLTFLRGVYGNKHNKFVEALANRSPFHYYTSGIIIRDGKGESRLIDHNIDLRGRSWDDRIQMHYEIAQHEYI